VAVAAAVGIAAAAAALLLGAGGGGGSGAPAAQRPLQGMPPLVIDLPGAPVKGGDAAVLAAARRRLPAGDVRLRVAAIVAHDDPAHRLEAIAALRLLPQDEPVVLMALGLAQLWAGRATDAQASLEKASQLDPYGYYGSRADNLLFARSEVSGYPPWVSAAPQPKVPLARLRARAQADSSHAGPWLDLAAALERSDRVAAIAAAGHAALVDPTSSSALVAQTVLGFRKDRPMATIQTLQNLLERWPADPEIEFHLALVYLWLRDGADAAGHFRQARIDDPSGPYAAFARAFARCIDQPNACAGAGGG
jgi:tetratricopeptide (TPR) repeat protein